MSWTNRGASVQVKDSNMDVDPLSLPLSSTSSVLLADDDGSLSLRVYLNGYEPFVQAIQAQSGVPAGYRGDPGAIRESGTGSSWTDRLAATEYIPYVNSAAWLTSGSTSGFSPPIVVDLGKPDQIFRSCIPRSLESGEVTYFVLTDLEVGVWDERTDTLSVLYKDPSVVAIPEEYGGGWLMVLVRCLVEPQESGGPNPDNSFTQIVAWWSNTEDFSGSSTLGPFLLVDSASNWADGEYVRVWMGTPGAAIVPSDQGGHDLYVYFSVDRTARAYGGTADDVLWDTVSRSEYYEALSRLGIGEGVAGKRISVETLMDTIDEEHRAERDGTFPYTTPDTWEPSSAISGTLLGHVRLWLPNGKRRGFSHSVRGFFADYSANSVRFADPAPAACGDASDAFALYVAANTHETYFTKPPFSATSAALGSGHGLWRGRALPEGTRLYYNETIVGTTYHRRVITTLGKDFLCATQDASSNVSPDQLVETGNYTSYNYSVSGLSMPATHIWLDPDPVALDDGAWRISGGAAVSGAEGGDYTAFSGTAADGCEDATSLLDLDVDELGVHAPGGGMVFPRP